MSEKEKQILDAVKRSLPNMTDFDKGYFLGFSESKAGDKRKEIKKEGENA